MQKFLSVLFSVILALHGLIHLMGATVYLRLGTIEQLAYKTTLLNGRWDVGQAGIAVYGALWSVAALGFVLGAAAVLAKWSWARTWLAAAALLSLALTVLDWNVAYAGVILNAAILAILWLGPRIGAGFISKEFVIMQVHQRKTQ